MEAGARDPRKRSDAASRPGGPGGSAPSRTGKPRGLPPTKAPKAEEDAAKAAAKERKAVQRTARKKQQEERRRQREKRREENAARRTQVRAEKDKKRRKSQAQRVEKKRQRKRARKEKRQVLQAKRRARRLAAYFGALELARRFGRLVWPAYTRKLPPAKAVGVLVLNVVPFPGLGTALYGKWERGLVQFLLTFVFLLGWVWAVTDGVRIVIGAFGGDVRRKEDPGRVKRSAAVRR